MDDIQFIKSEVIKHGVKIDALEQKVNNFDVIKDAVIEISTTLRHMQEDNIKRDQFYKEQSDTLKEISLTIGRINDRLDRSESELRETNQKIEDTNEKLEATNEKLEALDKKITDEKIENIKTNSISIISIFKKGGIAALTAFVTGLVGYLLWRLGIKK